MSLSEIVQDKAREMQMMREVTVIMRYGVDHYPAIIAETPIIFSPKTDKLDDRSFETIRKAWGFAMTRRKTEEPLITGKSLSERLEDLLVEAFKPSEKKAGMEQHFIDAAKYPVPSEYEVHLPLGSQSLRKRILESLVPFHETRSMLLRLERDLELPMRHLQIMHVPVNSLAELQASARASRGALTIN